MCQARNRIRSQFRNNSGMVPGSSLRGSTFVAIFEGPLSIRSLGLGTQYVYGVGEYHKKYFQLTFIEGFSCIIDEGIGEICKKFKSYDFKQLKKRLYLQYSCDNPAHPAALLCPSDPQPVQESKQ